MTLGIHFSNRTTGLIALHTPTHQIGRTIELTRGASENLPLLVAETVAMARLDCSCLNRIGIVVGPGALTPLRVSMATAQTISAVAQVPLVGVSAFEMLVDPAVTHLQIAVLEGRAGRCLVRGYLGTGASAVAVFDQIDHDVLQMGRLLQRFHCPFSVIANTPGLVTQLRSVMAGGAIKLGEQSADHLISLINRQGTSDMQVEVEYGYAPT